MEKATRFNAPTLRAGLSWRQVTVLRAYGRYLKQLGFTYGEAGDCRCDGRLSANRQAAGGAVYCPL